MSATTYEIPADFVTFRKDVVMEEGGQQLKNCFQCSSCTLSCPVQDLGYDLNPRKIIRQVIFGQRKEVLESKSLWQCVGCYECADKCPQDVRFTEVMAALRHIAIRDSRHKDKSKRIILPKEAHLKHSFDTRFKESVWLWGRMWEPGMAGRYFLYGRGFPFGALIGFRYISLILNLVRKTKVEILPPRTGKIRKEVREIFARAEKVE